jgi:hypothetical protein
VPSCPEIRRLISGTLYPLTGTWSTSTSRSPGCTWAEKLGHATTGDSRKEHARKKRTWTRTPLGSSTLCMSWPPRRTDWNSAYSPCRGYGAAPRYSSHPHTTPTRCVHVPWRGIYLLQDRGKDACFARRLRRGCPAVVHECWRADVPHLVHASVPSLSPPSSTLRPPGARGRGPTGSEDRG